MAKKSSSKKTARELENKVAWVIGARGSLGSAIARELALAGARVVMSSRSARDLKNTAQDIGRVAPESVSVASVDLASRTSVDRVAKGIAREHGRIDILVNCTAAPIFGDFLELTDDQWDTVLQTKLYGYMRSMRAVIPYMLEQGAGSIVNVSGRGGRQPTPAHLPGSCANIAVNTLTKGLADIYGPRNIRINAVAPGVVETDMLNLTKTDAGLDFALGIQALKRLAQPDDIGGVIAFLASEDARWITGETIHVDGGSKL